jgi:hypothetical protein
MRRAIMADAPEIPEATDPFEKRVAISIAVLAVALSIIGNLGDNAKTDAILKTNEASNKWAYYQSKSIKENMVKMEGNLLDELGSTQPKEVRDKSIARLRTEETRYEKEKEDIKKEAEELQKDAATDSKVNDRCDLSTLLLQIGVVICSVAILSRWHLFWYIGMGLGAAGISVGVTAFLM